MDVRTMERVTSMVAAGAAGVWGRLTGRSGGGAGRGRLGGLAGMALAALGMSALVGLAAAQEAGTLEGLFAKDLPKPLAVAYLAAPYTRDAKGPSDLFRVGIKSPASSLLAKFSSHEIKKALREGESKSGKEPWEGETIELFKATTLTQHEPLSLQGSALGLSGSAPLSLRVYAFLPEAPRYRISKVRVWDSDVWSENPKEFSALTDTSFQLEANPVTDGVVHTRFVEVIACVNKRGNHPVCDGDRGSVIEDPLSGQPALLMLLRDGLARPGRQDALPDWLREVPTEICVEGQAGHVIGVPKQFQTIRLSKKLEENGRSRWCSPSPQDLKLDYIVLREEGLQLGSHPRKMRLDSRYAPNTDWRMLADRPKTVKVGDFDVLVQRIILHPPVSSVASASGQKHASEQAPSASSFEITFAQLPPPIRRLWYGALPSGVEPTQAKCENQAVVLPSTTRAKAPLNKADDLKLDGSRLQVKEQQSKQVNWQLPHALIAESADGQFYCGIAMPSGERAFTVTVLLPNQAPSQAKTVTASEKEKATTPSAGKEKVGSPPIPQAPPKKSAVAAGPPVVVVFGSADKAAKKALSHVGKVENEDGEGVFHGVDRQQLKFALAADSPLVVLSCEAKQLTCQPDGRNIELLPKEGVPLPKSVKQVVVNIEFAPEKRSVELTILREGPALLSIEQVSSKGQVIDRISGIGPLLQKTVQWGAGDKLRVRPAEADLQKLIEIKIAESPWPVQDDRQVEIPLQPEGKAPTIVIKTADRLFSGPVIVTTRGGSVSIVHGETLLGSVEEAAPRHVEVEGAKHGDALTIRPVNPEHEVAKVILRDGQKPPTVVHAPAPSFTFKLDRSHLRPGDKTSSGDKLAALSLEAEVREIPVTLPNSVLLKPEIKLGKGLLPLQSCKVTLAMGASKIASEHTSKGTLLKFGPGQSVPQSGRYTVEFELGASPPAVCRGVVAEGLIAAAAFRNLGPDRVLKVPLKRPGSRAFVGIVSLSKELRPGDRNWRSALEALQKAFEAANERPMDGADDRKGKYIWRAIYGPDGEALIKSETADETGLAVGDVTGSVNIMERLTDGSGLQGFDTLLIRAGKDLADFEGNVDMLIVSDTLRATCGWSTPPRGSRAVLVRLAAFKTVEDDELKGAPGVRACALSEKGKSAGVVAELEVVPGDWKSGVLPHVQLERAIAEAAKRLFSQ